jgi:hypothetical protein
MRAFHYQVIIAHGATGVLYQAGIDGNAFVDGKSLGFELAQNLGILPRYKFKIRVVQRSQGEGLF